MSEPHSPIPIAVIGMSCRFPGANTPEELWDVLAKGQDTIGPIPPDRPFLSSNDPHFQAGFLNCPIDTFDAKFFGLSPREASFMDPQHRLLLEVSWEALENSFINPLSLKGTNTGVFVGIWQQDYAHLLPPAGFISDYFQRKWVCNSFSCAASRLSHFLGLNGPSLPFEAACASSMVSLHYACQSLRHGETNLAIASGVNLLLYNPPSEDLKMSAVISPDYRCKTFDESANGYVRSEGCGVVVLKKLCDAQRDRDNILGIILGSACNTDGAGTSFGTPNAIAQAQAFRDALRMSGVKESEVSYLEAHGTGTAVGDPTEMKAIQSVYGNGNKRETPPLMIGSLKPNIGHTEAAAGIASLIKVLLCFQNNAIPGQIHLKTINPKFNLEAIPARICMELTEWKSDKNSIVAAVNSFGLSGTNVHVILQGPPNDNHDNLPNHSQNSTQPQIVTISAKSKESLVKLRQKYMNFLENTSEDFNFALDDIAFTANTCRAHFRHRMAIVANDTRQLKNRLQQQSAYMSGIVPMTPRKIAFLFTGQGSQYFGMAKNLFEVNPKFREEFLNCDQMFQFHLNISLKNVIWEESRLLEETMYCQPAIFCIQIALFKFWESLGIIPDFVLGHSLGEFAAAVCCGMISLEDGMKMVVKRSALIQSLVPSGAMLALKIEQHKLNTLLQIFQKENNLWVDIAAKNSPEDFVVSGTIEVIEGFEILCTNNEVKSKRVPASHAFHSRSMDPILPHYAEVLSTINFNPPPHRCVFISGTTGKVEKHLDENYWIKNLRNTVKFSDVIKLLTDSSFDCKIFVEIGPHPILLGLTMANIDVHVDDLVLCPSLRKNESNQQTVLASLGKLYVAGADINWKHWFQTATKSRKIQLPTYAFERQRFWVEESESQVKEKISNFNPDHNISRVLHPFLGIQTFSSLKEHRFQQTINLSQLSTKYLQDHKIGGKTIFPATGFMEIILAVGRELFPNETDALEIQNLALESPLPIQNMAANIQTRVYFDNFEFRVEIFKKAQVESTADEWKRCASAVLAKPISQDIQSPNVNFQELESQINVHESPEFVHAEFYKVGFTVGSQFQAITSFRYNQNSGEVLTKLKRPIEWKDYVCHPIVSDALLLTAVYTIFRSVPGLENLALPIKFKKFTLYSRNLSETLYTYSSWENFGDIVLFDEQGIMIARMEGLEFYHTFSHLFLKSLEQNSIVNPPNYYHEVWRNISYNSLRNVPAHQNGRKTWLIIADSEMNEISKFLISKFQEVGGRDVIFSKPSDPTKLEEILQSQCAKNLEGILFLSENLGNFDDQGFDFDIVKVQEKFVKQWLQFSQTIIKQKPHINSLPIYLVSNFVYSDVRVDGGGSSIPNLMQSTGQGFFKAFKVENIELKIYSFDIDETKESLEELYAQLWRRNQDEPEPLMVIRNGQIYVPKLVPLEMKKLKPKNESHLFNPDSTYLITGGTSGIGLEVLKWMLTKGAQFCVVCSRTKPSAQVQAIIDNYNQDGLKILFIQADCGEYKDIERLLTTIKNQFVAPLRGIFHSAGVTADALISNQTADTFRKTFRAKVYGAWYLHSLAKTLNLDLDYFVMFSSIVSLIGNVGQSNYIAANHFLDRLVQYRISKGLPGIVINWGPWAEVGLARNSRMGQSGAVGMTPMMPAQGILALETILQNTSVQTSVLASPTNFDKIGKVLNIQSYLSEVIQPEEDEENRISNEGDENHNELKLLANEIKRAVSSCQSVEKSKISSYIDILIHQILKLQPEEKIDEEQPLIEMGMDSLMTIELRAELAALFKDKSVLSRMSLEQDISTASLKILTEFLFKILTSDDTRCESVTEEVRDLQLQELVNQDLALPEYIYEAKPPSSPKRPSEFNHIFLTGATGFVGAHFLAKFNRLNLQVTCLIRGSKNLENILQKFELLESINMNLIHTVQGDVTIDNLGLEPEIYEDLSSKIDAVVHCAAMVNHLDGYTGAGGKNSLRSQNVFGLVNVLKFVRQCKKPLLFPSTLAAATTMDSNEFLLDDYPKEGDDGPRMLQSGYILSKWVGEALIARAVAKWGILAMVIRFPTLLGNSKKSGFFPAFSNNHFSRFLLTCIRIGHLPDWGREEILVMPVDVAVEIATALLLKDEAELGGYNLTFKNMPSHEDFKMAAKSVFGIDLKMASFLKWTQMAIQGKDSLLKPFQELYEEEEGSMPKIITWNILYTTLLKAKLNVTSAKLLRNLPNVDQIIQNGKIVLQMHLDYMYKTQPELQSPNE